MPKPGYLDFQVAPEVRDELQRHADRLGVSLSAVARRCLMIGLRHAADFEPPSGEWEVKRPGPRAAIGVLA